MPITKRHLETWEQFLRAHATITRCLDAELIAEHGITLSDYDVLFHLVRAPDGRLRPTELSDQVLLTRSGVTRLLARLEKQKLVAREPCPEDGRVTYAAITTQGEARLTAARRTHLQGVRKLFADRIDAAEADQLASVLGRLLEAEGVAFPAPETGDDG